MSFEKVLDNAPAKDVTNLSELRRVSSCQRLQTHDLNHAHMRIPMTRHAHQKEEEAGMTSITVTVVFEQIAWTAAVPVSPTVVILHTPFSGRKRATSPQVPKVPK